MAKRLSVEEATRKVIDNINLLKDAENVDIEKHMNRYASLRELEGEERETVYQEIAFALFGDYREEEGELDPEEEPQEIPQEAPQDEPQGMDEEPQEVAPQMVEEEPQEEAPGLQARGKRENVPFSVVLPPRAEIVPLASPEVATKSLLERLLSFWDGTTATIETAWEMYLYPVVMVLLSLLGAVWAVAKTVASLLWMGGKVAYRGARVALPVMGAITIQAWGCAVVVVLLGAKIALQGGKMALQGARVAYQGATLAAKEIKRGWELREEMCREWREEVA